MSNLIDEHSRESLLVRPERRWSSANVIEALTDVMVLNGVPEHTRQSLGERVARASTQNYGTSSSTVRSSTRSRRGGPRPNASGFTTTPSDRAHVGR
jgi:hypothetical protein